jgi:hypothetical protein
MKCNNREGKPPPGVLVHAVGYVCAIFRLQLILPANRGFLSIFRYMSNLIWIAVLILGVSVRLIIYLRARRGRKKNPNEAP